MDETNTAAPAVAEVKETKAEEKTAPTLKSESRPESVGIKLISIKLCQK